MPLDMALPLSPTEHQCEEVELLTFLFFSAEPSETPSEDTSSSPTTSAAPPAGPDDVTTEVVTEAEIEVDENLFSGDLDDLDAELEGLEV